MAETAPTLTEIIALLKEGGEFLEKFNVDRAKTTYRAAALTALITSVGGERELDEDAMVKLSIRAMQWAVVMSVVAENVDLRSKNSDLKAKKANLVSKIQNKMVH